MGQPYVTGIELNGGAGLAVGLLAKESNDIVITGIEFDKDLALFSVSGGFILYSDFVVITRTKKKIVGTFKAQGVSTSGQTMNIAVSVYNGEFAFFTPVTVA